MKNYLSLGYMFRVFLTVSANFPDNPRKCDIYIHVHWALHFYLLKQVAMYCVTILKVMLALCLLSNTWVIYLAKKITNEFI